MLIKISELKLDAKTNDTGNVRYQLNLYKQQYDNLLGQEFLRLFGVESILAPPLTAKMCNYVMKALRYIIILFLTKRPH